ncbi:MAG: DUF2079 domain-containing protein [Chloroflexi bacterium]|nr:DUF2079 domain-containing protein [Chloroflexota bacterium]
MNVFFEFLITLTLALGVSVVVYAVVARRTARQTTASPAARAAHPLSAKRADRIFLAIVLGYTVVFGAFVILRYLVFEAATNDLAQYDQLIWNSLNGRLLLNSYIPDAPQFLGKSFSPILLALVPLYAVWSSPIVLLIVETLAIGVGSLPIYWLARARLGRPLALVVAAAYFLYPAVTYVNLIGFSEIALAIPLLGLATFFLLRKRDRPFLVCIGVALLVKEEIAFIVVGFGVFVFLIQRRRALGLTLAGFGGAFGAVLLQYVIPYFRGAKPGDFYYFGSGSFAGGATRYGYLGHSLTEVAATLLTRPEVVLAHVLVPGKIEYLLQLLVPLAFLPVLGADVAILALATLGYTLLSDYVWQYDIQTLYPAPLIPFLFVATVVGLERLSRRVARWKSDRGDLGGAPGAAIAALLLVASVSSYWLQSQGPLSLNYAFANISRIPHAEIGHALLGLVPKDAIVVAQTEYLAHLSERQSIYEVPAIPDYRQADYLFLDKTDNWYRIHQGHWDYFLNTGYFETVASQDGYVVARRVIPAGPRLRFGGQITLLGCAVGATAPMGGTTLRPILAWQADVPLVKRYAIDVEVVDAAGHVWVTQDSEPQGGRLPTTEWTVEKSVGDQYALDLPPTMPGGEYFVTAAVHDVGSSDGLAAKDSDGNSLGANPVIAQVQVSRNKSSFTASELRIEEPKYVDMAEMRFLGYVPPRQTVTPGEPLHIGLYWRARAKPLGDYTVAVQLRDAAGAIAFEQAARPAGGTYPTNEWSVGEVLLDWHDFNLPSDIAPGEYEITVVLTDANRRVLGQTTISTLTVER